MRPHASRLSILAAPMLAASSLFPAPAATAQAVAEQLAPGWAALPAETIACVRVPDTRGFLASLREGTELGQRVLTEERLSGFFELFKEQNADAWGEFTTQLEEVGLSPEELGDLMQEPWGAGWVMAPTDARPSPRNVVLLWADLDEEHIDTLYTALDQNQDMNERAVRTDLELGGCDVRQYALPKDADPYDDAAATFEDAPDVTHLLVTRLPGRVVLAVGTPEAADAVKEARAAGGELDWDTLADIETVHGVLDRYLNHTAAGGDADGFVPRLGANPGVAAATHLGRGDADPTLAEFYLELPAVIDAFQQGLAEGTAEGMGDPGVEAQVRAVVDALALDELGAFAGSVYSANGGLQMRGFLGAPAPRAGLVGMLDGTTLPAAPPAWVPTGVGYGHLAFDLSKLWDLVLNVTTQVGGPQAAQQLQMANGMTSIFIQADLATALRSFGTAHRFLSLPDAVTVGAGNMKPFAVVWDPTDPAILQRIIAYGKQQLGVQPGVTPADEQGFSGLRFEQQGVSGAAMLGPSNLVIGAGGDLTDRIITSLNNPPAPADALAGSEVFQTGQDVLPYQEGFFFQFSDGGRDMVAGARQLMNLVLDANSGVDPELAQRIEALMPSDDDLIAAVGASVVQMRLEDGGIVMEGAMATPAAQ